MLIPLTEPVAPRYIYINPTTNKVHLLVPVVGGQEISTDNTCQSTASLKEFFTEGGALRELNAYKSALEFDLQLLDEGHSETAPKQQRLTQTNAYIEALIAMKGKTPTEIITRLLEAPSNLYSIQLRPRRQDPESRVVKPVFNIDRHNDATTGTPLSALYNAMHTAYHNISIAPLNPQAQLNNAVLNELKGQPVDFKTIQRVLAEQSQRLFGLDVDYTQNVDFKKVVAKALAEKAAAKTRKEADVPEDLSFKHYVDTLMGFTTGNLATTQDYIDALLGLCAPNMLESIEAPPFYSVGDDQDTKEEKLSILTQFFLAHVNIHCKANGISDRNFGAILDKSSDLSDEVSGIVLSALMSGTPVEESLCTFFNEHADEFGLTNPINPDEKPLTQDDIDSIKQKFERTYRTVTATKENPQMDDFMILDTTSREDQFITHQASICTDFSELVGPSLNPEYFQTIRDDFKQINGSISHKNEHIKASIELSIEELLSHIKDDDQFDKLLDKLPHKLRLECMKSPVFQLRTFLHGVAKGKQDEAERMLADDASPQTLLTTAGTFTDYSGRTFTCTAYEYAYWSKDKHMCRMLEAKMNTETKAIMLARIDALESNGLTYTQHSQVIAGSTGFNLSPLIAAYEYYIRIYTAWLQAHCSEEGRAAVIAAWMNVGKAQRDLPAHYVNEYFRKDRSFDPLPKFDEPVLPRELKFYNCNTDKDESLFPLVLSSSSGLGVDFAFIRADSERAVAGVESAEERGWWAGCPAVSIDLAAVSHLDVVRTEDLKQSHKNLEPASLVPGMT